MVAPVMLWRRRELQEYFLEHELYTAPILGNLLTAGFLNLPGRLRCGDYFTLRQGSRLYGVAAIFNDGNMMVRCEEPWNLEIFNLAAAFSWHTLWDYSFQPGVGGRLSAIPGVNALRPLILMERNPAFPLPPQPADVGILRADERSGDPRVLDFIAECMRECFHFNPDAKAIRRRLAERTREEWYLVAEKGGELVSQAHVQSWTPRYGVIGGVASLLRWRGQGLGAAVTAGLCRHIEGTGRASILTVDTDNAAAIRLYENLGFREAGRTFACHRKD